MVQSEFLKIEKGKIKMDTDSAIYLLNDMLDDSMQSIINNWSDNKGTNKKQPWKVIPAKMMIREWQYNKETGLAHDTVIDKIQTICVENYLKLYNNTILMGHSEIDPYRYCYERYIPDDWTDEYFNAWLEDFEWYACDKSGNWRISDYGLEQIGNFVVELIKEEENYNNKLYWIDRILNVVHQRSDLSSWFIEGGRITLCELADRED